MRMLTYSIETIRHYPVSGEFRNKMPSCFAFPDTTMGLIKMRNNALRVRLRMMSIPDRPRIEISFYTLTLWED